MKVLFDNGTPRPIAKSLVGHQVVFARQIGWHQMKNGELLQAAEEDDFDLFLTTDRNLRYQQNLALRKIAIVVLGNSQWPNVQLQLAAITEAVNAATPGSYTEIEIPRRER